MKLIFHKNNSGKFTFCLSSQSLLTTNSELRTKLNRQKSRGHDYFHLFNKVKIY